MDENYEDFEDLDINSLIVRFEKMLSNKHNYFFDVNEFEGLIDYYFFKQDYDKIDVLISNALEQYPNSIGILLKKAQFLALSDKPKVALELLTQIERLEPANPDIYITKANIFSEMQLSHKAIEEYKKAMVDSDELEEIFSGIAFEYENLGNYEKAIDFYKKVLTLNINNESALFEISFCFENSNKQSEGIDFYKQIIDRNPYSEMAWNLLGTLYAHLNKFDEAIEAFDYAIAINDQFYLALENKADTYKFNARYKEAIEIYLELLELNPSGFVYYTFIGECYEKMDDFKTALQYYYKFIELDGEFFPDNLVGIAICYNALADYIQAMIYINKAIVIAPENGFAWHIKGDIYMSLGDFPEAKACYKKTTELDPSNEEIWLDYSEAFYYAGDIWKAIDIIEEGILIQALNYRLYYRYACLIFMTGNEKSGIEKLEYALQNNFPDHIEIFEFAPELKDNPTLIRLINQYNNK